MTQHLVTIAAVLIPSVCVWDMARRYLASAGQLADVLAMLTHALKRCDALDALIKDERATRDAENDALVVLVKDERVAREAEQRKSQSALSDYHDLTRKQHAEDVSNIVTAVDSVRTRMQKFEALGGELEQHNQAQEQLAIDWQKKFQVLERQLMQLVTTIDARVAGTLAQAQNGNVFRNPGG